MQHRVAFDLDLTLGQAVIHPLSNEVLGFHLRPGCVELLEKLAPRYTLCLWSISSRWYVERVLAFGLRQFFAETYSWDQLPAEWKDIRKIEAAYLIDDNPGYRVRATQEGIDPNRYIVVPPCGSSEDLEDTSLWRRVLRACTPSLLSRHRRRGSAGPCAQRFV